MGGWVANDLGVEMGSVYLSHLHPGQNYSHLVAKIS